jgi:hypothetical protein
MLMQKGVLSQLVLLDIFLKRQTTREKPLQRCLQIVRPSQR